MRTRIIAGFLIVVGCGAVLRGLAALAIGIAYPEGVSSLAGELLVYAVMAGMCFTFAVLLRRARSAGPPVDRATMDA